jgi:cyclopropane-fatty-acyl-phospholipid synthase
MRSLIGRIFETFGGRSEVCFRVIFSDGSRYQNHDGAPELSVIFRNRRAEWNVLLFSHVGLLESYFNGSIDIEGDLAKAFRVAMDSGFDRSSTPLLVARNWWHEWRFSNRSLKQAKANANYHYGLGTDFYRYWLDNPAMMYTCAYWKEGTRTLEEAQRNKMDHVCRKLQLEPGETLVDIGCGWGGFMFHSYDNYGALATGYNATTAQVQALRQEIERRALQDKLKVVEKDFREVEGQFDKCASIGVLEHAGKHQLPESIRALAACLKPGGLGVLHYIGHVRRTNTEFYIRKHIFPGGWIPSLAETLELMERHGLEIQDVENLRRHYALTMDSWAERFDANWGKIQQLNPQRFDEQFRRKWRVYLYSCAEMFRSRNSITHLFQITFSKGHVGSEYPMSRRYLYTADS